MRIPTGGSKGVGTFGAALPKMVTGTSKRSSTRTPRKTAASQRAHPELFRQKTPKDYGTGLDLINSVNRNVVDTVQRNLSDKSNQLRVRKNITPYKTNDKSAPPRSTSGNQSQQLRVNNNMGGTPFLAGRSNATPKAAQKTSSKSTASRGTSNGPSRNPASSNHSGSNRNPTHVIKSATKPTAKPAPKPAAKSPAKGPVNSRPSPGNNSAAPAGPPVDPYAEFRQQAESIYKPQLDYLTGQENTNKANAATADGAIRDMYGNLVNDIRGRVPVVQSQYADAQKNVDAIDQQAKNNINANYEQSRNSQAETLKRLGIEAAAPQTMNQGAQDQAYYTSAQDSRGAATNRLLASESAASGDYINAQSDISAQKGTDQRAGVQRSLQDILGQLSGKKADVQSNISSQTISLKGANDDRVAAQQRAQQEMAMAQQKLDNDKAIAQQKMKMQAATSQRQYDIEQAKLDAMIENNRANSLLNQSKFDASRTDAANAIAAANADRQLKAQQAAGKTKAAAGPKPDPWAANAELANTLYPNQQAAGNAVKAIRDTVIANPGVKYSNAGDFIQAVVKRNPQANHPGGDMPQLVQLATQIYKNIYG